MQKASKRQLPAFLARGKTLQLQKTKNKISKFQRAADWLVDGQTFSSALVGTQKKAFLANPWKIAAIELEQKKLGTFDVSLFIRNSFSCLPHGRRFGSRAEVDHNAGCAST